MGQKMKFYIGLHHVGDARHFDRACLSIRALKGRKKPIDCPDVLVDSGAFTELNLHGKYRHQPEEYAVELWRLHDGGIVNIRAAVAQDYMCEPFILAKTGMTVAEHQRLTIDRFERVRLHAPPFHIMPVLQGYEPGEYAAHIKQYGRLLAPGMWVGVGSVCKRNSNPAQIVAVLSAIHAARPDLRLQGFGIKKTALKNADVRRLLYSADSMAWSYHARKNGKDANGPGEAKIFADAVAALSNPTTVVCRPL
jgi:hypothetical protein